MTRLKRQQVEWREVIKPVLGVLLVAQEPLGVRHIRQILGEEDDRLREGMERLGGLIVRDWQQRYSLFHLKLYEYLRQDEQRPAKEYIFATDEEQNWHKTLADWCEQGHLPTIWQNTTYNPIEQRRLEYARQHYLTHLYRAQQWQRLFEVLDEGAYGREKLRYDPSTRLYAQDLDLGQQAVFWDGWTLEQGITLLPRLWQYTLLRCSLASRADQYPLTAFRLLVLLKRQQDALGLAELLTNPVKKVSAICEIAKCLRLLGNQENTWLELFVRAHTVAQVIEDGTDQAEALRELGIALVQTQQWEWAERIIYRIKQNGEQSKALGTLAESLAQAQQWKHAERVIHTIANSAARAKALRELAVALAQAQQWEEAERIICCIVDNYEQALAILYLGEALAWTGQWKHAERLWKENERASRIIEDDKERDKALQVLAVALVHAQLWEQAQRVIGSIGNSGTREEALGELGAALAHAQLWEQAQRVIGSIGNSGTRVKALGELGVALAHAQLWEQAEQIWTEATEVTDSIEEDLERVEALGELGIALVQVQQWEQADHIISSIEVEFVSGVELLEWTYEKLIVTLIQAQQWKRATEVIDWAVDGEIQEEAHKNLRVALIQAQQWEQVTEVINSTQNDWIREQALRELGAALVHAQQWERAEALSRTIKYDDDRGSKREEWSDFGATSEQSARRVSSSTIDGLRSCSPPCFFHQRFVNWPGCGSGKEEPYRLVATRNKWYQSGSRIRDAAFSSRWQERSLPMRAPFPSLSQEGGAQPVRVRKAGGVRQGAPLSAAGFQSRISVAHRLLWCSFLRNANTAPARREPRW